MALNVGPGGEFLAAAIVIGVILLVAQIFSFPLGMLGTILMVAAVVLLIAWVLKLVGIL
jgi:hypothetical protein